MRSFWFIAFFMGGCSSPKEKPSADVADEAEVDSSESTPDSGEDPGVDPLSWSVTTPGPYRVGYLNMDVTYSPGASFEDRTIRLNIWYPTDQEDGSRSEYTVGIDELAFSEAEPAVPAHGGGYPLHVHSHGFKGYGATSAFLSRYFASHGWVTVAPDHTQNTLIDHVEPLPSAHYFHRPLDVRASIDAISVIPADHLLGGLINPERVVLSGHSFGAYTTWASLGSSYDLGNVAEMCSTGEGIHADGCTPEEEAMFSTALSDERVVSSIPMAGTIRRSWFGNAGELTVNGPVLFFGGTEDDRGQQEQFDQMGDIDFTWMEIEGACHQSFALGACESLDVDLGFSIIQTASLAFARITVLADSTPEALSIANGETSIADVVTVQRR